MLAVYAYGRLAEAAGRSFFVVAIAVRDYRRLLVPTYAGYPPGVLDSEASVGYSR